MENSLRTIVNNFLSNERENLHNTCYIKGIETVKKGQKKLRI